jgi:PadR family transcriptional regulator, regulatory protein AphA
VSSARPLTTTSYGILGLLAVRPYSSYELTREMGRSLGRLWPRTASKLYEEPKKLVDHGLARARSDRVGRRSRTVYAITPRGRKALAAWLEEPGAGPVLEFEALVKLLFAEHGSSEAALASIARAREWAVEQNQGSVAAGEAFLRGDGRFRSRAPETLLVGAFLTDYYALVARWADWATAQVESWPDDPTLRHADAAEQRKVLRRARWT